MATGFVLCALAIGLQPVLSKQHIAHRVSLHDGAFSKYVRQWEAINSARYPGAAFAVAEDCNGSHNATHGLYPDRPAFYSSYLTTLAQSHHAQVTNLAGLEVGAMHNRAPVPSACKMTYVDAAKGSDLLIMHPELQGSTIVEPDIIDNVEKLSKLSDSSYDFVIASHLLEHAKNFLQALEALLRVTKRGGMVLVTLPNKCTTFDRMRLLTTTSHIVAEYEDPRKVAANQWEHFREWSISDAKGRSIDGAAVDKTASVFAKAKYHIHYHTFTADSVIDVLSVARKLLKQRFDVILVAPSEHEIRVVIIKS